jgi:monofunctional biosynthetic peptidoglycan transglycosylase
MKKGWKYWLFVRIPVWFILASLAVVTLLRWVPVRYTPVMLKRVFQFREDASYRTEQEWVSLEDISPELIKAVILSEDQNFYFHHGFDWAEINAMWKSHRKEGTRIRGCSTISQQTAKNVFTFGSPTVVRKAMEAWWTVLIEVIWGKNRILEVYLNVAETGRGLFGMETAAREYYGVNASELTNKESISLAVCLPEPLELTPFTLTGHAISKRNRIIAELFN